MSSGSLCAAKWKSDFRPFLKAGVLLFRCMDGPRFLSAHPRWTRGLLPHFSYCERPAMNTGFQVAV